MGMEGFLLQKEQKSQAPLKLAQPFPAPESRADNFCGYGAFSEPRDPDNPHLLNQAGAISPP